jgi:hypothetical protein
VGIGKNPGRQIKTAQARKPASAGVCGEEHLTLERDIMKLAEQIPSSEWLKLPKDLNDNLDFYLYGSAKRRFLKSQP